MPEVSAPVKGRSVKRDGGVEVNTGGSFTAVHERLVHVADDVADHER
jgi:hypothetical protein